MSDDCIFCRIVKNEAPATRLYEDDVAFAFLDIRPASEGHTLVIPKRHHRTIYDIPDWEIAHLYRIVKKLAVAVKKGMNAEGVTIAQQNEKAAGQEIFHLHVHVIPRFQGRILPRPHEIPEADRDNLDKVAGRIRQFI